MGCVWYTDVADAVIWHSKEALRGKAQRKESIKMARLIWDLCGPMVFYGLCIDFFTLSFKSWEPLACTLAGAAAALPFLILAYRKEADKNGRRQVFDAKGAFECVLTGIAACLMVNTVIRISGISRIFPGYFRVEKTLRESSFKLKVCTVGIVVPVAEELTFRGLGFERLRKTLGFFRAALISSAVFALYHGNMLQGIYGFCMGMILSRVMEKRKVILAPILLHMAANLTSVAVSAMGEIL